MKKKIIILAMIFGLIFTIFPGGNRNVKASTHHNPLLQILQ